VPLKEKRREKLLEKLFFVENLSRSLVGI